MPKIVGLHTIDGSYVRSKTFCSSRWCSLSLSLSLSGFRGYISQFRNTPDGLPRALVTGFGHNAGFIFRSEVVLMFIPRDQDQTPLNSLLPPASCLLPSSTQTPHLRVPQDHKKSIDSREQAPALVPKI